MKKNIIYIISALIIIIILFLINNIDKKEEKIIISGIYEAKIEIKDYGTITAELNADKAPITVNNFMTLANDDFYNGLTFHRIIKNFIMQGGAYKIDGSIKQASNIEGEFTNNASSNDLTHKRGAIAMARSSDYNSASSQFYIVQKEATSLDGDYAVFGYVKDGMGIVDKICNNTKAEDQNGTIDINNRPVINKVTIKKD